MKRVLWLVVLLLCAAVPCFAQNETATLAGRVTDQTGAVLVGATVGVVNEATGVERTTFTNEAGRYVVAALQPGTYRIVVSLDGFSQIVKTGVVLRVQEIAAENFELRVGSMSQSTTVTAGPVRMTTASPVVSTSIDPEFVERMPLNGRTIQSLLALTPGMITTQTGDVGQISSNGLRTTMNSFYIDGVSANIGVSLGTANAGYAGSGVAGFSTLGTTNNLVSVDALQEFTVQTSTFSAEYGRQPGAQVSMTTKSGTNSFRGSAAGYFRDDSMDAVDWFVQRDHLEKPQSHTTDISGTIGGPIVKNTTFFFASYEGLRLLLPNTMTTNVLANWLRQQAAPALKPYIETTPAPTGPDNLTTGLATFTASYSDPSHLDATSVRIDHVFSGKLTVFGRYNYSPSWSITHPAAYYRNQVWMRTQTLTAGATMILSPKLTNVVRFNWSDNVGRNEYLDTDFAGTVPLADGAKTIGGIDPAVSRGLMSFISGTGAWFGYNGNNTSRQYNVTDTLTWAKGTHTFRLGLDYRRFAPTLRPALNDLLAQFTSTASVISGVATAVTETLYGPGGYAYGNTSIFGQDSWRLSDRLTLDYGLRWDINPSPSISPSPMLVNGAPDFKTATLGEPGQALYDTQWGNIAPRVGGAWRWRTTPGWESVIRGGWGMFFDVGSGTPATGAAALYPHINVVARTSQPFPFPAYSVPQASTTPPYPATSYLARYDGYTTPRVYQWNAAFEQALGRHQRVTLTYVGNAGRRLLRRSNVSNRAYANPLFSPSASFFVSTNVPGEGDESDYRALQAQFFHQSRSLRAIVGYTWGRAMDTNGSDTNPAAIADPGYIGWLQPAGDYTYSGFDRRHNFSAAVTWNLPAASQSGVLGAITRDWSLDWVLQAQSGRPMSIVYAWTFSTSGQSYTMRPDLVAGQSVWIDDPNEPDGRRLNPAAFAYLTDPSSRPGNVGRNSIRGYGYWQGDVAIGRQFTLPHNMKLRFKAEIFNAFNVANFRNPSPNLGLLSATGKWTPLATFGKTTQMLNRNSSTSQSGNDNVNAVYALGGPRAVQLTVRLTF